MKVSIIIATFNRSLQLSRGLITILKQEILPDEIVIIDDGSVDDTRKVCESFKVLAAGFGVGLKYKYLNHPEHRISSIPRNVGIKQSTGDLIIFTEPEILHVGNTIKQLLDLMKSNPNKVPVATQIWTIQQKIYDKLNQDNFERPMTILTHKYAQLTESPNLDNLKAPNSDWAITGSKNCLTGCLFACEKKWLLDIGGFDESFEGHGWDDFDLFERFNLYGTPILKTDDIIVIHQWHEKNYPYNIIDAGQKNGEKSKQRVLKGEFKVNIDKEWGIE